MQTSGESFGVVGALQAFPLRLAARRVGTQGGRLHRSVTRGTTSVVFGRTLLSRFDQANIEQRIASVSGGSMHLLSENGFLRTLGTLPGTPPATIGRQAMLEQSRLGEHLLAMLTLFDAFESHVEPYSFRDLVLARKYAGLVATGANWSDIARAVHQIGPVGSLTALTLQTSTDRIVARDAHSLAELNGQRLLPLSEPDDEAEDYFGRAETAEAADQIAEAATLYQHCIAIDTVDATAAFNLGNCLRKMDDLSGAALAYVNALKRDALFIEAWFNYGGVLRDMGRIDAARQHLQRAVELDPTYADAIYNLGALEYDAGNLRTARNCWQRYLEFDTTSDWARRARAGIGLADRQDRSAG